MVPIILKVVFKVVVASIIVLVCLVLFAVVSSAYRSGCAGELPPIANLRTINTAEVTYLSQSGSYGTMSDLIAARLLEDTFMGTKAGYNYTITLDATGYTAEAVPGPVVPKRRSWFSSTDSTTARRYGYYSVPDAIVRYSVDASLAPSGQSGRSVQ